MVLMVDYDFRAELARRQVKLQAQWQIKLLRLKVFVCLTYILYVFSKKIG